MGPFFYLNACDALIIRMQLFSRFVVFAPGHALPLCLTVQVLLSLAVEADA